MRSIVEGIVGALVRWLVSLVERGDRAVDSPRDHGALRRAGGRIRDWLHQNHLGPGGESDQNRPKD
jgi:hypothetical protein